MIKQITETLTNENFVLKIKMIERTPTKKVEKSKENEKISKIEEKSEEPKKLSKRQLEFTRDDAKSLCRKYFNKNYVVYKSQILDLITKKFEKIKKRKENTDKIYQFYVKFYEQLEDEKNEKFYVETNELF